MAFSDLLWLQHQLARFTYRPGWRLEIVDGGPLSAPVLRAKFTPDTYQPSREIRLTSAVPVPLFLAEEWTSRDRDMEEAFARWLQSALFDMERHESQEWLRRDGVIYDNPHERRAR